MLKSETRICDPFLPFLKTFFYHARSSALIGIIILILNGLFVPYKTSIYVWQYKWDTINGTPKDDSDCSLNLDSFIYEVRLKYTKIVCYCK